MLTATDILLVSLASALMSLFGAAIIILCTLHNLRKKSPPEACQHGYMDWDDCPYGCWG